VATREFTFGTYNMPSRYSYAGRRADVEELHTRCSVLVNQEIGESSFPALKQDGWRLFAPFWTKIAYGTTVSWDPDVWTATGFLVYQISAATFVGSPGAGPARTRARSITAARLRHDASGRVRVFASIHLVASRYASPGRKAVFNQQIDRAAMFMRSHPKALLGGDFNSRPGETWMSPLRGMPTMHYRTAKTHHANIDQVWAWRSNTHLGEVNTYSGVSDHKALLVGWDWAS
jgi:hypothetical protein